MPLGCSQHPSPLSPAGHVHAAGAGSSAATCKLSKRSLLTLLIPLFSLARLPASLPGGGLELANCVSKLQCVSLLPGVLFSRVILGAASPCLAVQDRVVSYSTPFPFPFGISSQIILVLD